jgi:uncharacterized protein
MGRTWQNTVASRILVPAAETACCPPAATNIALAGTWQPASAAAAAAGGTCGCGTAGSANSPVEAAPETGCGTTSCRVNKPASFQQRLWQETWQATTMVAKFMLLAFFLEAIIILYVPADWIVGLLGQENAWAVLSAALLGIPVYTSNLAALPLVSGLLAQGMNPGAGLAFLIAGPTTTLPAMAAVWGLTSRRVFVLYVSFSLGGAVVLGYVYTIFAGF